MRAWATEVTSTTLVLRGCRRLAGAGAWGKARAPCRTAWRGAPGSTHRIHASLLALLVLARSKGAYDTRMGGMRVANERSPVSDAQQLFQIFIQDGLFLLLRQALQTQDPGDRPVNRHVGGPVGAKDYPVDTDRIDQHAQGGLAMGQTIVVELAEIGAGWLLDVCPCLGTHLPAPVHAADAEAGIAAAVCQTDLEVGACVHHPTEDQGREGHGPVRQIANSIGQMIPVSARAHHGRATLVHKDQGLQLLGCLPEGQQFWCVEGLAIDRIIEHGAFEAELSDAAFEFIDSRLQVLHRQGAETSKAVRVVADHLTDFVVRLAAGGHGLGVGGERVVPDERGHHLHVHAQGVHVCQTLHGIPGEWRREGLPAPAQAVDQPPLGVPFTTHTVPVVTTVEGLQHAVRHEMGMNINTAHSTSTIIGSLNLTLFVVRKNWLKRWESPPCFSTKFVKIGGLLQAYSGTYM